MYTSLHQSVTHTQHGILYTRTLIDNPLTNEQCDLVRWDIQEAIRARMLLLRRGANRRQTVDLKKMGCRQKEFVRYLLKHEVYCPQMSKIEDFDECAPSLLRRNVIKQYDDCLILTPQALDLLQRVDGKLKYLSHNQANSKVKFY